MNTPRHVGALVALGLVLGAGAAKADAISDFYGGKRMAMLIGLSTGGAYDRYARLVARHMGDHIPGKPSIIPRNMTGGGSLIMTNYVYNVAPQDGTHIGAPNRGVPAEPLVAGERSLAKYDPLKMHWIGSLTRETSIGVAWHSSGIKSYKDLYEKEFVVGGTGGATDSVTVGYIFSSLLGMKFKMIVGYPGGNEINLAMERGEVMGRATNSWSAIKSGDYSRVKEGKLILLYQMGAKKNNEGLLKDVPFALDFAKDARQRQILFLKFAINDFGYPYFLGPGVPRDRVATLREAFKKVAADPRLKAEAEKSRMDLDPIFGEEMDDLLKQMYSSSPDVVAGLREVSRPNGKTETAKGATEEKKKKKKKKKAEE